MRIVYHLGAHCTDEERLLKCLLRNRGALGAEGIVVPGPARYRTLLRDTAVTLRGDTATRETQALVLDQIMQQSEAERLILSWDSFLAYPQWALRGALYPTAGERVRSFARIFPEIPAEFHLAIRNPATFLPALFERQKGKTYEEFIGDTDLLALRWSGVVENVLALNPGGSLTIWCDEDTPLIWPEVLQRVSGHAPGLVLEECDALLAAIMSPDGFQRLSTYLADNPPKSEPHRRRVVSAFLDKFVLAEEVEMEVEMPGWSAALIEEMTALYEEDVSRIAALPGVAFIAP